MAINSQAKGKRAERDLARWFRDHGYPDAERAVKTGTAQTHDGGDLILEFKSFRMCVEVKHHAGGLTDSQVLSFGIKLQQQRVTSKSHLGILVERRDRVSQPALWWAYLDAWDLAYLRVPRIEDFGATLGEVHGWEPVRAPVGYVTRLLREAGLAQPDIRVPSSASSITGRVGTAAGRPQAAGGT